MRAADFITAWGKAEPPLFAFRHGAAASAWSMSTRPREPQTAVEQTLSVSFAEDHTDVDFRAELLTSGGSHFQLRLPAPPKFIVERLSLLEERRGAGGSLVAGRRRPYYRLP